MNVDMNNVPNVSARYENEVADVPPEGDTHYRCGASECDRTVLPRLGEEYIRHTEYTSDTVQQTLYCSNRCLFASIGGGDDDD